MIILNYVFIIFALVTIIKYINFDCIILAPLKICCNYVIKFDVKV